MLCTPPAFILSQDQTLKQIVYLPPKWLDSVWAIYLSFFYFLELCYFTLSFWQICISHLLNLLCTSIFCCSIVKVQSLSLAYARACLLYHSLFCLSRGFLKLFQVFSTSFFKPSDRVVTVFAATSILYHIFSTLSRGFSKVFWNFFKAFWNRLSRSLWYPVSRQPQYSTTFPSFCQ